MRAYVYVIAEIKLSKKGEPYAVFSIKDERTRVFKCLAFGELASKCDVINRQGEEIICDGNIKDNDTIFLTAFTLPERKKLPGTKKAGSRGGIMVTDSRPYTLSIDDEKRVWVRYEQQS